MAEKINSNSCKGSQWKNKGGYNFVDMYNMYIKDADYKLSKAEYRDILRECNNEFMKLVLAGREVRMPYLSTIFIAKTRNFTKEIFDYAHYNKTGEKKFNNNDHSAGYRATFRWTKNRMPIVGGSLYTFIATRKLQRTLGQEMKKPQGHAKYTEYGR